MRPIVLLPCLLLIAGCDIIRDARLYPQVSTANAQMAAAKIDCDAKFRPVRGTYLAHAKCIDAAQNWIIRPLTAYPDLLARSHYAREALAAQVDAGDISPADLPRLTSPEDAPLTVAAASLRGPLSRYAPPDYYAPPATVESGACVSGNSFSDCHN